jgi:DNA invertase Pin-like site-specific DNA recombinase
MGRAFLGIVAALAQTEAEVLSERTRVGLHARREAGVKIGPKVKDNSDAVERAKAPVAAGESVRATARQTGMSSSTLLRRLKAA